MALAEHCLKWHLALSMLGLHGLHRLHGFHGLGLHGFLALVVRNYVRDVFGPFKETLQHRIFDRMELEIVCVTFLNPTDMAVAAAWGAPHYQTCIDVTASLHVWYRGANQKATRAASVSPTLHVCQKPFPSFRIHACHHTVKLDH